MIDNLTTQEINLFNGLWDKFNNFGMTDSDWNDLCAVTSPNFYDYLRARYEDYLKDEENFVNTDFPFENL